MWHIAMSVAGYSREGPTRGWPTGCLELLQPNNLFTGPNTPDNRDLLKSSPDETYYESHLITDHRPRMFAFCSYVLEENMGG